MGPESHRPPLPRLPRAAASVAAAQRDHSRRRGDPGSSATRPSPRRSRRLRPVLRARRRAAQVRSRRTWRATSGARIVSRPWRHLRRAVGGARAVPSDEALHDIRIRAKRLRYACEAVEGVVGRPAANLARAAADLQGVLGDFHDAIVGEDVAASGERAASSGAGPRGRPAHRQLNDRSPPAAGQEWPASWKRINHKKLRPGCGSPPERRSPRHLRGDSRCRGRWRRVRSPARADCRLGPREQLLPSAGRRRPPRRDVRTAGARQGDAAARRASWPATGEIGQPAADAAIETVGAVPALAESLGAEEIVACATAAFRDARDSAAVVDRIEAETGVKVKVISGKEEARLIFGAVRASVVIDPGPGAGPRPRRRQPRAHGRRRGRAATGPPASSSGVGAPHRRSRPQRSALGR